VIRVNSQSGKGGVAYLLERDHAIRLPRRLQIELSQMVQKVSDSRGGEVTSSEIWEAFKAEYIERRSPFSHHGHQDDSSGETNRLTSTVSRNGVQHTLSGEGNGPIEAFIDGFQREFGLSVRITNYEEHAIGDGANACAICYVQAQVGDSAQVFGVGMHPNIVSASLNAIVSAVNRSVQGTKSGQQGAGNRE
jgi:2-isopropylmalate synthase